MKTRILFFISVLALSACKKDPTDEELTDALFGTWEPYLISTLHESHVYEDDSTFFYENGARDKVLFLSEGKMVENGRPMRYSVLDGNLLVINELDTNLQDILFVDNEKLVLDGDGAKVYYEKFVY